MDATYLAEHIKYRVSGFPFTGDAEAFLRHYGCSTTAEHSARVADAAAHLAVRAGVEPERARLAGWLHDISGVIPVGERVAAARGLGVELLPEEEAFPLISHQKLSVVLARELFGVSDEGVLGAIGCHTTLRAGATALDKVVYVADKLEWDQKDAAPYAGGLRAALEDSVDDAARFLLVWAHEHQEGLKVLHPWTRAAYEDLVGLW